MAGPWHLAVLSHFGACMSYQGFEFVNHFSLSLTWSKSVMEQCDVLWDVPMVLFSLDYMMTEGRRVNIEKKWKCILLSILCECKRFLIFSAGAIQDSLQTKPLSLSLEPCSFPVSSSWALLCGFSFFKFPFISISANKLSYVTDSLFCC